MGNWTETLNTGEGHTCNMWHPPMYRPSRDFDSTQVTSTFSSLVRDLSNSYIEHMIHFLQGPCVLFLVLIPYRLFTLFIKDLLLNIFWLFISSQIKVSWSLPAPYTSSSSEVVRSTFSLCIIREIFISKVLSYYNKVNIPIGPTTVLCWKRITGFILHSTTFFDSCHRLCIFQDTFTVDNNNIDKK